MCWISKPKNALKEKGRLFFSPAHWLAFNSSMRAQLPDTIPSICDSYVIVMCSDDCVHWDCQLLFFAVFTIICAAYSCFKSMCSLVVLCYEYRDVVILLMRRERASL